jgi:hypothetical protein
MNTEITMVDLVKRRHPDWQEHHTRWRWLLDSLEGGERYRNAVYGYDRRGLPIRNLVRHKREYPDAREGCVEPVGVMGGAAATDDDYELRRARTPVPTFVAESIETHLSRIYGREVRREGPKELMSWWEDVDGLGTSIDHWMSETIAPLLLVLGQLDIWVDHPPIPEDVEVTTLADDRALRLDRCVASYILPENMVWWQLDAMGRYAECLVRELHDKADGTSEVRYRFWTSETSVLLDEEGHVIESREHDHGRVPIVRLFDRRKARCRNIGQSRYEGIAERQREYYNRDSELILSDTTQAHPLLQAPEDYVQADGTIPIGPSWLLPKKKNIQGGTTSYEGFDVVQFPKEGAESIRRNKADLREDIDRDSALIRPATRAGEAQSGLAKMIDHQDSNHRLIKIAKVLARAEEQIAELALAILSSGISSGRAPGAARIEYSVDFDLLSPSEITALTRDFQAIARNSGELPETDRLLLSRLLRLSLPGLSDAAYLACDAEIEAYIKRRQRSMDH